MKYDEFINRVADLGSMDKEEATSATMAFFETLGARLTAEEAADLAAQLPEELTPTLISSADEMKKIKDEGSFYEHIGAVGDSDPDTAKEWALAVWGTLNEAVSPGEIEDIKSQLPPELSSALG